MKVLTSKELWMIDQVMVVPLYASGSEDLVANTGYNLEEVKMLQEKIRGLAEKDIEVDIESFDRGEFEKIIKIYSEALPLAEDFDHIPNRD